MIRVIRGVDRRKFARELDAFHKIRKHVFFDTFRWDVPIINSWEIDGYDALDPVYLLSVNEAGQVVGGLRLLPTMGFNMLNDTFPQLLPEGKRIESPWIWESEPDAFDTARAEVQLGELCTPLDVITKHLRWVGVRKNALVTVMDVAVPERRAFQSTNTKSVPARILRALKWSAHGPFLL